MTVQEFNKWIGKHGAVYCFVNSIDHALDKAGDEAKRQMKCTGWNDETKEMLNDALDALEDRERSMIDGAKIKIICTEKEKQMIINALRHSSVCLSDFKSDDCFPGNDRCCDCIDKSIDWRIRNNKFDKLKPCPFCGNKVIADIRTFDDFGGNSFTNSFAIIECKECGFSMRKYPKQGYYTDDIMKKLIGSWNRRAEG